MTLRNAITELQKLEILHCGEGADESIPGFPCLEPYLNAIIQSIGEDNLGEEVSF